MAVAGIICEYNPIHGGHVRHFAETKALLGGDTAVVCVMSGNFVQRGEPAVFEKHARASAAVRSGADLVVELPLPYVLSSAEGFARGGVRLLDALGVVTHLSFGSEAGDIEVLRDVSDSLILPEMGDLIRKKLRDGIPFAAARQSAAQSALGDKALALGTPNNILGIEYLKALKETGSVMEPVTVRRSGGGHDEDGVLSSSYIRKLLREGRITEAWERMPSGAAEILKEEILLGRGPVFTENDEAVLLSRLRMLPEAAFLALPDATEGLGRRLMRYAGMCPDIESILASVKTKRYALSRLRRMLMCACLGVQAGRAAPPPPYIRVLAFNSAGRQLLRTIREKSALPVITKPAAAQALDGAALDLFKLEAAATDLYVLLYPNANNRTGGAEWKVSPAYIREGV